MSRFSLPIYSQPGLTLRPMGQLLVFLLASNLLTACSQQIRQSTQVIVQTSALPRTSPSASPAGIISGSPDPNSRIEAYCLQGEMALGKDQGLARNLASRTRQELQTLLSLLPSSQATAVPSPVISPGPSPVATSDPLLPPTPTTLQTADISVISKTTLNGKVFNRNNQGLDGVTVRARSLNTAVAYDATTQTAGGIYTFNNVPAGIAIEITASLPGYTTRRRVEVLKSNKDGDPNANRFDFGNDGTDTTYGPGYNALSDLPEIIASFPGRDAIKVDTLTEIRLTFSEPMDKDSVEQNLVIKKLVPSGSPEKVFDISAFFVSWNADDTEIRLKLQGSYEFAKATNYRLTFSSNVMIKDKSGAGRNSEYFRLSDGNGENELRFGTLAQQPGQDPNSLDFVTARLTSPPVYQINRTSEQVQTNLPNIIVSPLGTEWSHQALQAGKIPDPTWLGPQDLLTAEVFDPVNLQSSPNGLFRLSMGLWKHPDSQNASQSEYEIGTQLTAPFQCQNRPELNLTLVVNTAERMQEAASAGGPGPETAPTKLALLKQALLVLGKSFRPGDQITLISFARTAAIRFSQTMGTDLNAFNQAVEALSSDGSAELQTGLAEAYHQARTHYANGKLNRVLLFTDIQPQDGNIDLTQIKTEAGPNNQTGIALSLLVMGELRNPNLVAQLTEAGRGISLVLQSRAGLQGVLQDRLLPLVNPLFRHLHFQMEFPTWLKTGSWQQASLDATTEFIPLTGNRSLYRLNRLTAGNEQFRPGDTLRVTLTYDDPLSGETRKEVFEKSLDQILDQDLSNIKAAHLIQLTTGLIQKNLKPEVVQSELNGLLQDVGK